MCISCKRLCAGNVDSTSTLVMALSFAGIKAAATAAAEEAGTCYILTLACCHCAAHSCSLDNEKNDTFYGRDSLLGFSLCLSLPLTCSMFVIFIVVLLLLKYICLYTTKNRLFCIYLSSMCLCAWLVYFFFFFLCYIHTSKVTMANVVSLRNGMLQWIECGR